MDADRLQTENATPQGCTGTALKVEGKQGITASTQARVGAPTNEIINEDGTAIAWDVIEETARRLGIVAAASECKVKADTIRKRARDHKWKKIPDGRTLAKLKTNGVLLETMTGDLSHAIDRHRAMIFEKTSKSIAKFRPKAPKSFRELDSADKVARRALGIDDSEPAKQSVLIQINEAIENHEMVPVEAHEIVPCITESTQPDEGQQGSSAPPQTISPEQPIKTDTPPKESNAPKESASHSLTLNPGDSSRRQFVVP